MERRVLLAVLLMFAAVIVVNLLFPPTPRRQAEREPPAERPAPAAPPAETAAVAAPSERRTPPLPVPAAERAPEPVPAETVEVSSPLYRFAFVTGGAGLVTAELLRYESLASEPAERAVQLVRPGSPLLLGRWVLDRDTFDLTRIPFTPTVRRLELTEETGPQTLEFVYEHPAGTFRARLAYRFFPDRYVVDVRGTLEGGGGGWWRVDLGTGLENNEADTKDNLQSLALVVNGPEGIQSKRLGQIDPGEVLGLDGPHWWVAVRDKYFVVAVVAPDAARRLGGAAARGSPERYQARITATAPVTREGRFEYRLYMGPQDAPRLARIGRGLQDVNPYGWAFLRPVIRPLARGITALLLWAREGSRLGYGWILILFGFAVRVVLLPLYQSTMRSQMKMAELQPLLQEIQARYRSDPPRLQQEMMRLYREKGMNPLSPLTSGCLPMLLPFPFLIALFFVFRDTIEFRGADFLWMPDLARPDPLYIIPVLMGLSMFLLSWLGQRAVPQTNPQFKMIMYVMPVMMTIFFLALPAGLNVYYFAMNVASIPQQVYLNRERRRLAAKRASQ